MSAATIPVTLWIVGKATGYRDCKWEFQGVFGSECEAALACRDGNYFIGPAVLGQQLPDQPIDWTGAYYPKGGNQ